MVGSNNNQRGEQKKKKKNNAEETNHNNTREQEIKTKVIHNSELGIIQGHGDIPDIETKTLAIGGEKKKKKEDKEKKKKQLSKRVTWHRPK